MNKSYTWRSYDGPLQGESSWSIIHKFCFRNAIDGNALIRHINSAQDAHDVPVRARYDLRFSTHSFVEPIMNLVDVFYWDRIGSGIDSLTGIHDVRKIKAISASSLRYCPICISNGFHATCMQLLSWKECPIHTDVKLLVLCQNCKKPIPYAPPKLYKNAYACENCGSLLWENKNGWGGNHHPCSVPCHVDSPFYKSKRLSLTSFGLLNTYWMPEADLKEYIDSFNYCCTHLNRNDSPKGYHHFHMQVSATSDECSVSYKKTYKSILRHIKKRHNMKNNSFFRILCITPRNIETSPLKHMSHMSHYAFATWRSYWENVSMNKLCNSHLHLEYQLDDTLRSVFGYDQWNLHPSIKNKNLEAKTLLYIFSVFCITSFQRIHLDCTNVSYDQWINGATLPWIEDHGGRKPFFMISNIKKTQLLIHWFVKK